MIIQERRKMRIFIVVSEYNSLIIIIKTKEYTFLHVLNSFIYYAVFARTQFI